MADTCIEIRFLAPAPALSPYISAYYETRIDAGSGAPISDRLHPEWADLRLTLHGATAAAIGDQEMAVVPEAVISGPTSLSTRFSTRGALTFGIGLLPLGWAAIVGADAALYADRSIDLAALAGAETCAQLLADFRSATASVARAKVADAWLLSRLGAFDVDAAMISRTHGTLTDPQFGTVAEFAAALDLSPRQLQRLTRRNFGFSPKLLLRRQRFVRTLAELMLDPAQKWSPNLDIWYHDQAHFTRDFKRFMGMTPTAYMAMPHPIMAAAAIARQRFAGAPMQALHRPGRKGVM